MQARHLALYSCFIALLGSGLTFANPVLPEIIVTAELRATNLQLQSASTTVVTSEVMVERAAQHLEELLNIVPNVNYASGSSRARFYQIRGIGERSQFIEPLNPSVGYILDGVDFSGIGGIGTLFDIQQVEILRGPQGTLHGANALAGLINLRSNEPTTEFQQSVDVMVADYNSYSLGLVSSGPLGDETLLYRVALQQYASDGFIDNDYLDREDTNDRDELTLRGKLRWLLSDNHTLDLMATYIDIDNGYDAFSLDNTRHTLSDQPGQDTQQSSALALSWHALQRHYDLQTTLTWASSDSDYGYDEDWAYDGIHPDQYMSQDRYRRERDSYSFETRLVSNEDGRLFRDSTDWVVGLYYLSNEEDLQRDYTYLESVFRSRYDTASVALFGQFNSQLNDSMMLIAGLRWERRDTDYSDNNKLAYDPEKNLWGGKLALEYTPLEQLMLYGSVSRGYKAGGVNASILASIEATDDPQIIDQLKQVRQFDEETLLNYELGLKGTFAQGSVQTRLAVFYMDRKDQQVKGSFIISQADGGSSFIDYSNNAAEGNNYGLELEVDWQAGENLRLFASVGLLETEYDKYVNAAGEDLSGREQAQAPQYQYALGGRYDFVNGFFVSMNVEGKDQYYFSDRHDTRADAYNLLNARLGFASHNWSMSLWGRNLTDEEVQVRGFGSFGNDPRKGYITESYYQFGEPRMVGIAARYSF